MPGKDNNQDSELEHENEIESPSSTRGPSNGGNRGDYTPRQGGGGYQDDRDRGPRQGGGGYQGGGDRDRGPRQGGGYQGGGGGDRDRGPRQGGSGYQGGGGGDRGPRQGGGYQGDRDRGPRPGGGDRDRGPRPGGFNNGGGGGDRGPRPGGFNNGGGDRGPRPGGFNSGGGGGDRGPRPGGFNSGGGGGDRGPRPGGFNSGGGGGDRGPRPGGFNSGGGGGRFAPAAPPPPAPSRDKARDKARDREREQVRDREFERDGFAGGQKGKRGAAGGSPRTGVGGNGHGNFGRSGGRGGAQAAPQRPVGRTGIIKRIEVYELPPQMTVKDLADELGIGSGEIIRELIKNGVMASINQQIDYDTASIVASELGFETTLLEPEKEETDEFKIPTKEEIDADPDAIPRPPVVTIMGHVDHGKTKLLDAIRSTNVVAGEAGGITQKIGAYQVEVNGKKITFLDTPGHEAFTQMRARGAQATDIVVLVVAADDGVMPQTLEALSHAKAANVPIIVAVNKIDREGANPDRVKTQLSEAGLMPEEWGGDTPFVHVSAKQKIGIEDLLEMILLVAELGELKANPDRLAVGTVIEAELDKNRGPVATVLVQNGTLSERDFIVVGNIYGKVRALMDDRGKKVRRVGPSAPVVILGLDDVPSAGDIAAVVPDEKTAKDIVERRIRAKSVESQQAVKAVTMEDLFNQIQAGKVKELRIILKADLQGSIEAIRGSLEKLSNDQVSVKIILSGTGAITESDVMLASTTGAIVIGFNVRPDPAGRRAADSSKVDIRFYNIIYNLIDEVKLAMSGLLEPTYQDVTDGYAEVRQVFKVGKVEQFAGLFVTDGKIARNNKVRVLRNGTVLFDGEVASLRRFKDNVTEVAAGYECGVGLEGFNDFQVGDSLEFYHKEQVKAAAL
ncbi:MAG TPA: translation initiation factor IF-2 [Chloroflexia bacterium]|nr:translation initiation factor IF-2 [Chloroflexia bacterium]